MRCINPFLTTRHAFGCGQCMPCRFNRRRTWTHRLMLEAHEHGGKAIFATLTFRDGCTKSFGNAERLDPRDLQRWLKRFRKRVAPRRVRFYGVGEYGDLSQRAHYHVALFGVDRCLRLGGISRRNQVTGKTEYVRCICPTCSDVSATWDFGNTHVGDLTPASAQYLAGYVTKKMTRWDDPRLNGRTPEFARMSTGGRMKTGGIGAGAMWNAASVLMQYNLEDKQDVPAALNHGRSAYPLGRYLRSKLRTYVGKDASSAGQLEELAQELQAVRDFAWANQISTKEAFNQINEPYARSLGVLEKMKGKTL